ncbi:hypothetical protein BKA81DRAFT_196794 [Phyllosticta paracitricarpa]|uniref:Uncharacterized protein n=1 Tax=Phyllosticta paracitricarpa TaxID=2016321 RepID=A0ABR1MTP4_9PEZI
MRILISSCTKGMRRHDTTQPVTGPLKELGKSSPGICSGTPSSRRQNLDRETKPSTNGQRGPSSPTVQQSGCLPACLPACLSALQPRRFTQRCFVEATKRLPHMTITSKGTGLTHSLHDYGLFGWASQQEATSIESVTSAEEAKHAQFPDGRDFSAAAAASHGQTSVANHRMKMIDTAMRLPLARWCCTLAMAGMSVVQWVDGWMDGWMDGWLFGVQPASQPGFDSIDLRGPKPESKGATVAQVDVWKA